MENGRRRYKVNYEQELQNLKNAQKNAAMADLQAKKNASLSNLQAEEAKIKPEYAAQRSTANANNRVAARNFQEYLANTGRANSGIGAQYEMSRQNSLQNGLNAINAAEAASIADIARRRTDAENAYNSGLASANAEVEANYIKNLLNQRQQQWEREFAQKQFDEEVRQYNQSRQDALRRAFSSGGGSGVRRTNSSTKSVSNSNLTNSGSTANQVANAAANAVASVLGNNTASKTTSNNDYKISSVTSPKEFTDREATQWYVKNAQNIKTRSQLDSVIRQGLKSGKIDESDARKIYKSYGINI
jgi:hypothetical protein